MSGDVTAAPLQQQELSRLEQLADQLYNSTDPATRTRAESTLRQTPPTPSLLGQCCALLAGSLSPFAQYLAITTLHRVLSDHWSIFPRDVRLSCQTSLIAFVASRGHTLQSFALSAALRAIARVVKLGWSTTAADSRPRESYESAFRDLIASNLHPSHKVVGLMLSSAVVSEMSSLQQGVRQSLSQHSRTSAKFRDTSLLPAFEVALSLLRDPGSGVEVREAALKLALQALSFNFIGTLGCDEAVADDVATVQVPASWLGHFEDPSFVDLFFGLYATSAPPISTLAMECLVQIASARRSLFQGETQRTKFLQALISRTTELLQRRAGCQEQANHHALCRMLARIKANYQLQQLTSVEGWQPWVEQVLDFTLKSLQAWKWSPNSVHYLMNFWSRMVGSLNYLQQGSPHQTRLVQYNSTIVELYIRTRLESATSSADSALTSSSDDDGPEGGNPLGSEDHMIQQLEFIPSMGRCDYPRMRDFLKGLLDPMIAALQSPGSQPPPQTVSQLAWLVYVVGALIGGRATVTPVEDSDTIDGELACRVFLLLRVVDARLPNLPLTALADPESPESHLEHALVSFLQQFRRVYVGDAQVSSSRAYMQMGELIGLASHTDVLNVCLSKIMNNLRWWRGNQRVVDRTLSLFFDLVTGYSSGKLVAKLEITGQLLMHHGDSQLFNFPPTRHGGKQRALFYHALGKMLFTEDHEEKFAGFVSPIEATLSALLAAPSRESLLTPQFREAATASFCIIRGLAASVTVKKSYNTLFDWLHPKFSPLLATAADAYAEDHQACGDVMSLVSELSWNRNSRIQFDPSSPNGILLFREIGSRAVVSYGKRVRSSTPLQSLRPGDEAYQRRLKGVALCLEVMSRSLSGGYTNFGVFALYGDPCLSESLDVTLGLALEVVTADLLGYSKLAKAFFTFLDVLCVTHPSLICSRDSQTVAKIFAALEDGLHGTDNQLMASCCTSLDGLISWYVSARKRGGPVCSQQARQFEQHLSAIPEVVPRLLTRLFDILLYTDCQFQYSLARPIHSLLVASPRHAEDLQRGLVSSQPVREQQERMSELFAKLAGSVEPSLEPKSRDKFTQSLVEFSHGARSFISPV